MPLKLPIYGQIRVLPVIHYLIEIILLSVLDIPKLEREIFVTFEISDTKCVKNYTNRKNVTSYRIYPTLRNITPWPSIHW